jgi:hypothetical protein
MNGPSSPISRLVTAENGHPSTLVGGQKIVDADTVHHLQFFMHAPRYG